jgi:hypothetical protein
VRSDADASPVRIARTVKSRPTGRSLFIGSPVVFDEAYAHMK